LVAGDAAETVPELKAQQDKPLIIFGSGELVRSLMKTRLVDELLLMIHPLILGQGRRLFADADFSELTLADKLITGTGVIAATYAPR
jgi:dihydrofolate reductase